MLIGSLVKVIIEHPDGVPTENSYGQIGVITRIERHKNRETDYTVHNEHGDFLYGRNQITLASADEIADELYKILTR